MIVQGGERRRKSIDRKSVGKRWKERSARRGSCAQSGMTRDLSIWGGVLAVGPRVRVKVRERKMRASIRG